MLFHRHERPFKGPNQRWASQQGLQGIMRAKRFFHVFGDSAPSCFIGEPGLHKEHRLPVEGSRDPRRTATFLALAECRPCFEGTAEPCILTFPCGTNHGLEPPPIDIYFHDDTPLNLGKTSGEGESPFSWTTSCPLTTVAWKGLWPGPVHQPCHLDERRMFMSATAPTSRTPCVNPSDLDVVWAAELVTAAKASPGLTAHR